MKNSQRLFVAATICSISTLAGCGNESERQNKNEAAQRKEEELALMRDVSKAGPEIDVRLRKRIRSKGQIILVKEAFGELHAVPSTVGWSASCGLGGLNVSIAAVGEENGLSLQVSDAFLHEEDCTSLLPLTATKVSDILAGK
jgi:hypothetical protein